MENNYAAPKKREAAMRGRAKRQVTWSKKKWLGSKKGNVYLNILGYNLTLSRASLSWRIVVRNKESGKSQWGQKTFDTLEEAKAGAFLAFEWAKEKGL